MNEFLNLIKLLGASLQEDLPDELENEEKNLMNEKEKVMSKEEEILKNINSHIQTLDTEILSCDWAIYSALQSKDTSAYELARMRKDYANQKMQNLMDMRRSASRASSGSPDDHS